MLSFNGSQKKSGSGCMNFFSNNPYETESEGDSRYTLVLIAATIFLFIFTRYTIPSSENKTSAHEAYYLEVVNDSLSVIEQASFEKEQISEINWELTPFFFRKMPINTADREALMTIKGVGPKLAENILLNRLEYGPLKGLEDLQRIKGVGLKRAIYFENVFDFGY